MLSAWSMGKFTRRAVGIIWAWHMELYRPQLLAWSPTQIKNSWTTGRGIKVGKVN